MVEVELRGHFFANEAALTEAASVNMLQNQLQLPAIGVLAHARRFTLRGVDQQLFVEPLGYQRERYVAPTDGTTPKSVRNGRLYAVVVEHRMAHFLDLVLVEQRFVAYGAAIGRCFGLQKRVVALPRCLPDNFGQPFHLLTTFDAHVFGESHHR